MTCIHRWICDNQIGGAIPARCRECGAERVFKLNLVDDWNGALAGNFRVPRQKYPELNEPRLAEEMMR